VDIPNTLYPSDYLKMIFFEYMFVKGIVCHM